MTWFTWRDLRVGKFPSPIVQFLQLGQSCSPWSLKHSLQRNQNSTSKFLITSGIIDGVDLVNQILHICSIHQVDEEWCKKEKRYEVEKTTSSLKVRISLISEKWQFFNRKFWLYRAHAPACWEVDGSLIVLIVPIISTLACTSEVCVT